MTCCGERYMKGSGSCVTLVLSVTQDPTPGGHLPHTFGAVIARIHTQTNKYMRISIRVHLNISACH